jgi:hypothetical protein
MSKIPTTEDNVQHNTTTTIPNSSTNHQATNSELTSPQGQGSTTHVNYRYFFNFPVGKKIISD